MEAVLAMPAVVEAQEEEFAFACIRTALTASLPVQLGGQPCSDLPTSPLCRGSRLRNTGIEDLFLQRRAALDAFRGGSPPSSSSTPEPATSNSFPRQPGPPSRMARLGGSASQSGLVSSGAETVGRSGRSASQSSVGANGPEGSWLARQARSASQTTTTA
eukprot:CAMPEP_0177233568 /NCGR_PEP_ID=MMETSP0367-20130122/43935_1 /TAXON_ID=447022 ORGANISM="Scrippsiella hangoei-like, Strain SHHI-4" /NCGR_SAMPLE_ID=MMETSP0367 /ASSEMBLY_ACC=CAM_ASM_000362 /LENGTH=159 /DNA_ID=CAMNT_0018684309 /DNA_START=57 /DNA_END=533 /DNA_ORIENTATION=+